MNIKKIYVHHEFRKGVLNFATGAKDNIVEFKTRMEMVKTEISFDEAVANVLNGVKNI